MAQGYVSLSIQADTGDRLRDLRDRRGVTTDELVTSLLDGAEADDA